MRDGRGLRCVGAMTLIHEGKDLLPTRSIHQSRPEHVPTRLVIHRLGLEVPYTVDRKGPRRIAADTSEPESVTKGTVVVEKPVPRLPYVVGSTLSPFDWVVEHGHHPTLHRKRQGFQPR